MEHFKINKSLFSSDGVIPRLRYFGNQLIIGFALGVPMQLFIANAKGEAEGLFILLALICMIPLVVLQFFNLTKRIRDIAGHDNKEYYRWVTLFAIFIPVVGGIINLFLTFCRGSITFKDAEKEALKKKVEELEKR